MDQKKPIEVKGEKPPVVFPPGMPDEEKAIVLSEIESLKNPDRLPDSDPDEEYPR